MKTHETTTPVRAFDRAYINGQFVTPHGTQVVDLVNPTDNKVIGKVTMADEIDTRKAIGAAKEAFNTFSQTSKEYRMELLQRLHDAVANRMDQLVEATVVEYGAPQGRAKGSNNLAANIFLHFKKVLEDFDLVKTVGKGHPCGAQTRRRPRPDQYNKSRSVCSLRWVQTIGDRSGRRDLRAAGVPGTQSDHRLTRGMS
jgi:hypothetical protein